MMFEWIGWCNDPVDNHDKVWGIIVLERGINKYIEDSHHKVVFFWGRRGKKLQTKISIESQRNLNKLMDSKIKKGYVVVDKDKLDKVYPEFQTDLEQTAFWSTLKG